MKHLLLFFSLFVFELGENIMLLYIGKLLNHYIKT